MRHPLGRFVPAALLATLALAGLLPLAVPALAARWSTTVPAVNETHIFEGEINRRGKPVGFHSRPGGRNPENARVVRIVDGPNRAGVYIAEVEIRDPESGRWLTKRSTLYPDAMSRRDVIEAIVYAWENRSANSLSHFRGPSGRGFTIEGYLLDAPRPERGGGGLRINTAWPVYREGR